MDMKGPYVLGAMVLGVGAIAVFTLMPQNVAVGPDNPSSSTSTIAENATTSAAESLPVASTTASTTAVASNSIEPVTPVVKPLSNYGDIGPQEKLADPPAVIKGLYLTAWSAGS